MVFPQIQDGHLTRTIRSQTLYPLSYGCVVGRLYLFRGEKSRNALGGGVIWEVSIVFWCNFGAIKTELMKSMSKTPGFFVLRSNITP